MPPMTRDQARGAYNHVVGSVLDQDRDAPLRLALEKEGVSNIMHLLIMPEATIDAMTYDIPSDGTQAANADIPLQNVHKWTLKAFQSYAQYRSDVEEVDNGNLDEWRAINQGEFHNFQCNIFPSLGYTNTRIHSTPTGWPGTTCSPLSPIAEWKKGVERDMALYLEPQQDMEWDRWNTQLRATANTQEVDRAPSKLSKDRQVNAHITYTVDKCHMDKPRLLIDHGANGGIAGADEWETLPHIHWTRNLDWDPAIFNHEFGDNDDKCDDPVMDHRDLFDKVGNYRNCQGVGTGEVHSSHQIEVTISRFHFQARQVRPGEQDWETLHHLFGWAKRYKDAYRVS